jgi:hypothetical protein
MKTRRGFAALWPRSAGLALADAFHFRSVEGIKLPAALALLLRADLIGPREWPSECRPEVRVACDLAHWW